MRKAKIAEFKAKLSGYLQYVRKGESVTIYDRDNPIADVVPHVTNSFSQLNITPTTGDLKQLFKDMPKRKRITKNVSSLDILLEDRKR